MNRSIRWVLLLGLACPACSGPDSDLPPPYRDLPVPVSALASSDSRLRGAGLYAQHCVLCHGPQLDGHGIRQEGFVRPPRNFTDPAWRRSTSPRHVFYAVREGLRGTSMPAWKSLTDRETWDLVAYVLASGR